MSVYSSYNFDFIPNQAMAQDDPEFRSLMAKENTSAFTPTMTSSSSGESMKTPQDEDADDKQHTPGDETVMMGGSNGRWDKSLGVLCQKFVMLFLVTPVSQNILHILACCT